MFFALFILFQQIMLNNYSKTIILNKINYLLLMFLFKYFFLPYLFYFNKFIVIFILLFTNLKFKLYFVLLFIISIVFYWKIKKNKTRRIMAEFCMDEISKKNLFKSFIYWSVFLNMFI